MSVDGTVSDATSRTPCRQKIAAGSYFWLDLIDLDDEGSDLLTNAFHFHPLAVEDAEHFGQRPKVEDYDDFYFLVVAGAQGDDGATVEVHCFYSEKFLVTVERGGCSAVRRGPDPGVARVAKKVRAATSCCSTASSTPSSTASSPSSPASTTRSTRWRTPSWRSPPRNSWAPSSP